MNQKDCDACYIADNGGDGGIIGRLLNLRYGALYSCEDSAQRSSNTLHSRDDDTRPFTPHVDGNDTKPKRVDSSLFPERNLIDKIQQDSLQRERVSEAVCPKCGGEVYYKGLNKTECLTSSCENYKFVKEAV